MSAAWSVSLSVDLAYKPRQKHETKHADSVTAREAFETISRLMEMTGWEHYHTDTLPGLEVRHIRKVHKPVKGRPAPLVERATVSLARIGAYVGGRRAGKTYRAELLRGMEPSAAIWDETMGGR